MKYEDIYNLIKIIVESNLSNDDKVSAAQQASCAVFKIKDLITNGCDLNSINDRKQVIRDQRQT